MWLTMEPVAEVVMSKDAGETQAAFVAAEWRSFAERGSRASRASPTLCRKPTARLDVGWDAHALLKPSLRYIQACRH